jgi:hypothetical protein
LILVSVAAGVEQKGFVGGVNPFAKSIQLVSEIVPVPLVAVVERLLA